MFFCAVIEMSFSWQSHCNAPIATDRVQWAVRIVLAAKTNEPAVGSPPPSPPPCC
jgi:hypothetical protein